MNDILRQLFERRIEILAADSLMHLALYLFTLATIGLYVVAVLKQNTAVYEIIPILAICLATFVAARGDFLQHRAGGYVRYVESELPVSEQVIGKSGQPIVGWETWKAERKNTWLMFVMDLIGAFVLIFMVFRSQQVLWANGQHGFVVVTSVMIVLAGAMIPLAVKMAPR